MQTPKANWLKSAALRVGSDLNEKPFLKATIVGILALVAVAMTLLSSFALANQWSFSPIFLGFVFVAYVAAFFTTLCEAYWEQQSGSEDIESERRLRFLSEGLSVVQQKNAALAGVIRSKQPSMSFEVANLVVQQLLMTYRDVPGVRVSVFLLTEDHNSLHCLTSRGRIDLPRSFNRGDKPRGCNAIEWLLGNDKTPKFEFDTDQADHSKWGGTGEHYRTFISAVISFGPNVYGMLSVDAPQPGSLDVEEKHQIQVYADSLAVAFSLARPVPPQSAKRSKKGR